MIHNSLVNGGHYGVSKPGLERLRGCALVQLMGPEGDQVRVCMTPVEVVDLMEQLSKVIEGK